MSKRKVQFNEDIEYAKPDDNEDIECDKSDDNEDIESGKSDENGDKSELNFGKKFKHTLDSDEEDDELIDNSYNVLESDQIAGQEEATVEADGDVRITPFNMKEELETGHFDKEGNYIFDKTEEIRDNWLDHIDWVGVKANTSSQAAGDQTDDKSDDELDAKATIDLNEVYKEMIELMKPKESVEKAIQRLGKSCGKTRSCDRWKKSKDKEVVEKQSEEKEMLMKLSSLADRVLQTGDMDIYQKSYEHLVFILEKQSKVTSCESDMFSDNFEPIKETNSDQNNGSNNEVQWEFKWEDVDNAEVFGPHSSQQMLEWVNEGYFQKGVYVRQIGKTDSKFYTSKRIDFDLYT